MEIAVGFRNSVIGREIEASSVGGGGVVLLVVVAGESQGEVAVGECARLC